MGAVKKTDAIDVVTLEADNQVKDIQIAVLRREIEAQAALLKGLREDIARQTDEVSTLRKTVVDREACIRDLRASEVVRNESLVDLRNGIAARDKMIAGQQEELARMQKVVGSHDAGNLTSDPVMQKTESGAETESIKNLLQKIVRREEKCIKWRRAFPMASHARGSAWLTVSGRRSRFSTTMVSADACGGSSSFPCLTVLSGSLAYGSGDFGLPILV